MTHLSDVVVSNAAILSAEVQGELLIMDADRGKYYNLDTIGTDIWRRIATPVSVEALCRDLASDYSAPFDTVQTDVRKLIDTLVARKLARIEG